MPAANLGHDLDCWVRLLTLHDQDGLERAEPDTMRYRLYHLPARLATHARHRRRRIERIWPWAPAFVLAWQRLLQLPALTERRTLAFNDQEGARPRARGTQRPRSDMRRPTPTAQGTLRAKPRIR